MNKTERAVKSLGELQREYDYHRQNHNCYYIDGPDTGVERCPGEYTSFLYFAKSRLEFTAEEWLRFVRELRNGQISGQNSGQPNFRSENPVEENPVEPLVVRKPEFDYSEKADSLYSRFLKHRKPKDNLSPVARYLAGMEDDPQEDTDVRMVNEQTAVEQSLVQLNQTLLETIVRLGDVVEKLERIEDALAEREREAYPLIPMRTTEADVREAVKEAIVATQQRESLARRASVAGRKDSSHE